MSDTRNNDGRPETRASRPFRYCQCLRLRPQLPLAVRGQGFDPPQLHQCNQQFRSRNKFRKFPTSDFGSNETLFRRDSGIRSLASSVLFPVIDGRRSRPQPRLDRHRPGSRHHAYSDEVDHRFRGCFPSSGAKRRWRFWYRLSPGQKQSEKLTSTSFSLFSNATEVNRSSTNLTSGRIICDTCRSCALNVVARRG